MKTVRAKRPHLTATVPVRGGFQVTFQDFVATVPDDVADTLTALAPDFYHAETRTAIPEGARVLIERDMGLGDVLLLTPLIRTLATNKGAQVDVLTQSRYAPLFDGNPYVAHVLPMETDAGRREGYDAILNLLLVVENAELSGRYAHRADAFAQYADITLTPDERQLDYFVTATEGGWAREITRASDSSKTCAFVWRSSTSSRNFSIARREAVLDALLADDWRVVVLDHEAQDLSRRENLLDATGRYSIRETIALMDACDVVLTPDTGLFHAAQALQKPTVAYFGAMPITERQTHANLTMIDERQTCGLFPCRMYRCLNRAEDLTPRCLAMTPEKVVAALNSRLEASIA